MSKWSLTTDYAENLVRTAWVQTVRRTFQMRHMALHMRDWLKNLCLFCQILVLTAVHFLFCFVFKLWITLNITVFKYKCSFSCPKYFYTNKMRICVSKYKHCSVKTNMQFVCSVCDHLSCRFQLLFLNLGFIMMNVGTLLILVFNI